MGNPFDAEISSSENSDNVQQARGSKSPIRPALPVRIHPKRLNEDCKSLESTVCRIYSA